MNIVTLIIVNCIDDHLYKKMRTVLLLQTRYILYNWNWISISILWAKHTFAYYGTVIVKPFYSCFHSWEGCVRYTTGVAFIIIFSSYSHTKVFAAFVIYFRTKLPLWFWSLVKMIESKWISFFSKTGLDTRLPKLRAGGQGPYLRSEDHLGRSNKVQK